MEHMLQNWKYRFAQLEIGDPLAEQAWALMQPSLRGALE